MSFQVYGVCQWIFELSGGLVIGRQVYPFGIVEVCKGLFRQFECFQGSIDRRRVRIRSL